MKIISNYNFTSNYILRTFKNKTEADIKREEQKLDSEEREIKRQIDLLNKEQNKIENEQKKLEREKAELNS